MEQFQFVPDPNEHLRVMGETVLRISELLLARPWYIADYGIPVLLTSDKPVARYFRNASRLPATTGVSHTPTTSGMSLDSRRLLILGRPGDPAPEQYLHPPVETAATVNLAIAASACEYIYMHPDEDHLKGVQIPEAGPILQVNAELPFDLSRYNQPVTDTRAQRRK
jgi:hypothetical protein